MVLNRTKLPWMRDDRVILSLPIGAHNGDAVIGKLEGPRENDLLTRVDHRSMDSSELDEETFQEVPDRV